MKHAAPALTWSVNMWVQMEAKWDIVNIRVLLPPRQEVRRHLIILEQMVLCQVSSLYAGIQENGPSLTQKPHRVIRVFSVSLPQCVDGQHHHPSLDSQQSGAWNFKLFPPLSSSLLSEASSLRTHGWLINYRSVSLEQRLLYLDSSASLPPFCHPISHSSSLLPCFPRKSL